MQFFKSIIDISHQTLFDKYINVNIFNKPVVVIILFKLMAANCLDFQVKSVSYIASLKKLFYLLSISRYNNV